ncbi:hypothetical protein [Rhizobium sp. CFBP 8752]|uniref:hypothetical protein n=1 Tax=Rhizobium sp. CFBP 8752 TaxID=2775301 RepID=UPI0020180C3A|nr:hypothetical protein [Rhizobium sp. CFBP 8752]
MPDDIEDDLPPLLLDTIGTSAHAVLFAMPLVPPEENAPILVMGQRRSASRSSLRCS